MSEDICKAVCCRECGKLTRCAADYIFLRQQLGFLRHVEEPERVRERDVKDVQ